MGALSASSGGIDREQENVLHHVPRKIGVGHCVERRRECHEEDDGRGTESEGLHAADEAVCPGSRPDAPNAERVRERGEDHGGRAPGGQAWPVDRKKM